MSEKSLSNDVQVGLLVICSDDMDRAASFYSALGLNLAKHSHPPCGEHFSTIDGQCVFEIYKRRTNQDPTTQIFFGLNVPSVEQALEAAVANGGSIIRSAEESPWGRTAIIRDLDGHRVMLIERF